MTDDELERMLRGDAGAPGVPPSLERLLAAGRAPAHPGELAGEEAALTAFRAASLAHRAPPAAAARPVPVRRFVARMAAVKIAAVVAAVTVGGLGVAAATGTIDPRELLGVNPESSVPAGRTPGSGTAGTPVRPSSSPPGTPPGSATVTPGGGLSTAAAAGLCRDYLALPPGQAKKLLEDPPYDALARWAGGADEVAGFCTALVPPPSEEPGKPSKSPKSDKTPNSKKPSGAVPDRPAPPSPPPNGRAGTR